MLVKGSRCKLRNPTETLKPNSLALQFLQEKKKKNKRKRKEQENKRTKNKRKNILGEQAFPNTELHIWFLCSLHLGENNAVGLPDAL